MNAELNNITVQSRLPRMVEPVTEPVEVPGSNMRGSSSTVDPDRHQDDTVDDDKDLLQCLVDYLAIPFIKCSLIFLVFK